MAAAAAATPSPTSSHLLQHLLHRPSMPSLPLPLFSLFLKPQPVSSNSASIVIVNPFHQSPSTAASTFRTPATGGISNSTPLFSSRSLTTASHQSISVSLTEEEEEEEEDELENEDYEDEVEIQVESEELESGGRDSQMGLESLRQYANGGKPPSLTVKEKKELASYAHSLGKKLKSQLVGKSGVTANVATSFIETLEANELLKIKIHRTCPGELDDVVKQLEELTGSVVVSQIGRAVILYRPSLSKLKAEEKRRHARKIFVRQKLNYKSLMPTKGARPRLSGRGRRGRIRV